jgi:hypothetical protein
MPDAVPSPPVTLRFLLIPGIDAVRKYWRPFLLLQGAAMLLVVGYYLSPMVHRACESLSDFKRRVGLPFACISAAFAGAILPELAKAIMLGDRKIDSLRLRNVGFAVVVFAIAGIIADTQYRWMSLVFGNDPHVFTVIKKTLADQFITTPIYGVPYYIWMFDLRANRYNFFRTIRELSLNWYLRRVMPLLIPAWAFWLPMVTLIYILPGPLQFCLYLFAVAAWSLLMVFVASGRG